MITHKELLRVVSYNRTTGIFRWRVRISTKCFTGDIAGSTKNYSRNQYVVIIIHRHKYFAHRLAWFYVTKKWPSLKIDHKDRNGTHNWFSNLREASCFQSVQNMRAHKDNKTGLLGASKRKDGKYIAQIVANGIHHFLGAFNTPEAAHYAYLKAKRKIHKFNPELT